MKRISKIAVSLILAIGMIASVCVGCKNAVDDPNGYTYKTYTSALGNNWCDHTWETNADNALLGYITTPFVSMSIKDSENGVYQWIYEMATKVTDVTKDHKDDLDTYKVSLPAGAENWDEVDEGYVYEIALNPNAKWENGVAIKADDYIYSFKQLLNPKMRNYRANLYYSGESAVAGGATYYNSGAPLYSCMAYVDGGYEIVLDDAIAAGTAFISASSQEWELYGGYSLAGLFEDYGPYMSDDSKAAVAKIAQEENSFGFVKLTEENKEEYLGAVYDMLGNLFGLTGDAADYYIHEALFYWDGTSYGEVAEYEGTVGLYKVDDYTIRYVLQSQLDLNYFLTSLTSNWLVYEDLYEAGKKQTGDLVTTDYCTSKATTISYGPYKMASFQEGKQVVFVQNENWYGFTDKDENGNLISYTDFLVDGEKVQQYQTTKVVIDVMDEAAAKQAFLKGEVDDWAPNASELLTYSASDRLYKVDETYTMSFFFNTNLDALKKMDENGNINSVVLTNYSFRKAMSLAINRAEWVKTTEGYKPAYAILNNLYYYDVYNDPTSSYRNSDEAMEAICKLYNVEYGEGKAYATLKDAYKSITGFNIDEAKALFTTACTELVADGLYTAGNEIKIKIAYKKAAIETTDTASVKLIEDQLNAALAGTGFGKITLEAVGGLEDRYKAVPNGDFAIGYGAWGGAAFYPFRNFQVYCDTKEYAGKINEIACWNPAVETLTMTLEGEEVTMTWQDWSRAFSTGAYQYSSFATKLQGTANMEYEFLNKYYRIPLAGSTACSMLSFKLDYYTQEYNIMYDFGGMRLMKYNYNNQEWADYVKAQGGTLSYE